jgi:hypothetical protein
VWDGLVSILIGISFIAGGMDWRGSVRAVDGGERLDVSWLRAWGGSGDHEILRVNEGDFCKVEEIIVVLPLPSRLVKGSRYPF